jgi:hypothetical protein
VSSARGRQTEGDENINPQSGELRGEPRKRFGIPARPSVFHSDRLPLDVADFAQTFSQRFGD